MNSHPPKTGNETLHWENPRICCTCIHYAGAECRCKLTAFRFPAHHPACECYIPKNTD